MNVMAGELKRVGAYECRAKVIDGAYYCPCGASHRRGPIDGRTYRCLACGDTNTVAPAERRSILKDWVQELGLRHQGVLASIVRGCDTAPKGDASKRLARAIRGEILNAHCGDIAKAKTFMTLPELVDLASLQREFLSSCDHYPQHYIAHLMHAAEILGYKHPDIARRGGWLWFYLKLCSGLHLNHETEEQLDARLNADEETFAEGQQS